MSVYLCRSLTRAGPPGSPKIYQSMGERHRYPVCVGIVAGVVFLGYALIIAVGYYYYGCHTQIPGEGSLSHIPTQRSIVIRIAISIAQLPTSLPLHTVMWHKQRLVVLVRVL